MVNISKKQFQDYLTKFPEEAATIDAVDNFLSIKKTSPQVNDKVTGSAWIFNPNNGKVLLTQHKKLKKWIQLGGHYETPDLENIQKTALREAKEESGIENITPHSNEIFNIDIYLSASGTNPYYLYDFCFLFYTLEETIISSNESMDMQWVSTGKISTSEQFKSISNLAKKWQLFCFENTQEEKI